jgi:hypothetical protein
MGSPLGNGTFTVPFSLGEPFIFSVNVYDDTRGGGGSTPHFSGGGAGLSFSLLEADGTTPVQVFTPEPSTFGFLALGLLPLIGIALKRAHAAG